MTDPMSSPTTLPTIKTFLPSARALNWLLTIGFLALGYAFYLRYLVIEQPVVGQACDAGLGTTLCTIRQIVSALFNHEVFGAVAVGAAVLHLIRPSLPLFVIALVATAFGIVLYNVGLSAFAAALMMASFARPVVAPE
jgi:hypothetical protein